MPSIVKLLVLLTISISSQQVQGFDVRNVLTSATNVGTGLVKDAVNMLPTPEGFFESSKQLIAGYPFEFASSSINKICSSALSMQKITPKFTPDISKMNFQLRTACNNRSFPLLSADSMWKTPEFNPKNKVVILATGWTTTINSSETIDLFARAFNCRGNVNFVAVDAAKFVDTLYTWSAFNTEDIGEHIANGLVKLLEIVPLENIHLIGHSLGAHIVGAAGRHFNYKTGKIIPRITGLDPAKPCFNEGETLSGLSRGDAAFIDIIHSNAGVLGKRDSMGDVDFYPGGLDPLTPGCFSITCAHARAWEYFGETIFPGNENNFMAQRCTSLTRLRENKCPGKMVPMGYGVPHSLKGNYFLEVNGQSPFGKQSTKRNTQEMASCGMCKIK